MPNWCAKIRPFHDRPDIEQEWIFYSVPGTNPSGPTTVFTDRFWDHKERWIPPGVGTVPGSEKPYFGKVPGPEVTDLHGTDDEWVNGFSYEKWVAGGYPEIPCCGAGCGPAVRVRQAQTVTAPSPRIAWIGQKQKVGPDPTVEVDCCPGNPISTVLLFTIDDPAHPVWDGTQITLVYTGPGPGTGWVGSGLITGLGGYLIVALSCVTGAVPFWQLNALLNTGCGFETTDVSADTTCSPFEVVRELQSPQWEGCVGPIAPGSAYFRITTPV